MSLGQKQNVNINAWTKVAEKLDFIQNCMYKCRYEKISDWCGSPVLKNKRVRASFPVAEIHFFKRVLLFEMNGAAIARRYPNRSGDIRMYQKIEDEEYLLYQLRIKN